MRLALLVTAAFAVAVPAAPAHRPEQNAGATVVHAWWFVGGRFTRQEWYDPKTGATRREDSGGPRCERTTIASAGRIASFGCSSRRLSVIRIRSARDPRLVWQTSDLLRPRRLLRLGQAKIVGAVMVGERRAVRVRLPVNRLYVEGRFLEATHYADLEPASRLPLRFAFELDGQTHAYVLTFRKILRSALPPNFFSTNAR